MSSKLGEHLSDRLRFYADMNFDGAITISDVGLWFKWLYFMPGDLLMATLIDTSIGKFFEVTVYSMQGIASGVISFWAWLVALVVLAALGDQTNER